jgi:hypothetical protein
MHCRHDWHCISRQGSVSSQGGHRHASRAHVEQLDTEACACAELGSKVATEYYSIALLKFSEKEAEDKASLGSRRQQHT